MKRGRPVYYRAWRRVLDHIKRRLLEETELTEEDFFKENEIDVIQETFYLRDMQNNLLRRMDPVHKKEFASGKSAISNLRYIASSYAMTFNFLGNKTVKVLENTCQLLPGVYHIAYKRILRALKSKNAFASIDAFLLSEDENACICMETKMLEWFVFKINPIKDTYMAPENYFFRDTAPVFIWAIQLMVPFLNRDEWEHFGAFQNYDGFLLMRQILGMYNLIRMAREGRLNGDQEEIEKLKNISHLTFVSVYWSAVNSKIYGSYETRILAAEEQMKTEVLFLQEIIAPVKELFRESLHIKLQVVNLHYKELLKILEKTEEERRMLERYDV